MEYVTEAAPRTTTPDNVPVFCSYDEIVPIKELKPNPKNPNQHNPQQIALLGDIIASTGWRAPITVSKRSGLIVKGHGRRQAAIIKRLKYVPVEYQDYASEAEEHADLLADNRIAELAQVDTTLLMDMVQDMDSGEIPIELTGYTSEDLASILSAMEGADDTVDDGADAETDNEPDKPPVSQLGDLWRLGKHRLLCGSATSTEDVDRLMDGDMAQVVHTDPPYGVSYETQSGKFGMIMNDDATDDDLMAGLLVPAFRNAVKHSADDAAFYIWHASSTYRDFSDALMAAGLMEKEQIVWVKDSFVLGHADYHWAHEPCQPAGTMIRTPTGEVPIEQLKDGDKVVSYDVHSGTITGLRNGVPVTVANRQYDGMLYGVNVCGRKTWATDAHRFTVKFRESPYWCTYLMRSGKWWRVGITRVYTSRGFGLKDRMNMEHGEEAWIIGLHETKTEAMVGEQVLMVKYGIPTTHWNVARGIPHKAGHWRTPKQIADIYEQLDLSVMEKNAERLLKDHGRRRQYPIIDRENMWKAFSRRTTVQIRACNLIPYIMMIPIPYEKWKGLKTFDWQSIDDVDSKAFAGTVYSLDVERFHHYIADGMVTHNCIYAEKAGQQCKYFGDRSQSTAWKVTIRDIAGLATSLHGGLVITDGAGHKLVLSEKPPKGKKMRYIRIGKDKPVFVFNGEPNTTAWEITRETGTVHPTQKPVEIPIRAISNSSEPGDVVLDLFGGSGSTLIAAEMTGRVCRMTELDPKYVDAIVRRYVEQTGDKNVVCERDGKEYGYEDLFAEKSAAEPLP